VRIRFRFGIMRQDSVICDDIEKIYSRYNLSIETPR